MRSCAAIWRSRSAVLNEDDRLDSLKTQIFRELLTYMLQDPSTIEPALDLILVSRHLERIGDHATNIAEDVIFIVSARDVRHHAGEGTIARDSDRSRHRLRTANWNRIHARAHSLPLCVLCRRRPVDAAWRPFCSERCKTAGSGALGRRHVSGARRSVPDPDENARPEATRI